MSDFQLVKGGTNTNNGSIPKGNNGNGNGRFQGMQPNAGAGVMDYNAEQEQENGNGYDEEKHSHNSGFSLDNVLSNGNGNGSEDGELQFANAPKFTNYIMEIKGRQTVELGKSGTGRGLIKATNEEVDYFQFENGFRVQIQGVPQDLYFDVQRTFPPPPPPLNEVKTPFGGSKWVPNPHDPEYKNMLKQHSIESGGRMVDYVIWLGTVLSLDPVQREKVKQYRDSYRNQLGLELDSDDKMVYIKKVICDGNFMKMMELSNAIQSLTNASEEAIAEKQNNFRRNG
jgi:hypothetical protein